MSETLGFLDSLRSKSIQMFLGKKIQVIPGCFFNLRETHALRAEPCQESHSPGR